ncbi:MAG: hypothetical protein SOW56_05240 [Bacteroidaceae bacterium]|nr:hypothetical protein [Bacteroidaceae bacterium]
MKNKFKTILTAIAVCLATMPLSAQTSGSNSPYSRYGWGTLADESMGFNKAMSGVALGIKDSMTLNRQNPASYSEICATTLIFDAGISLQNGRFKTDGRSINAQNSSLDYMSAGFRLAPQLGFSFGLRPFSYVGYNFSSSTDLDDIDGYGSKTSSSSYYGDGGFRQIYIGMGWRPIKPLAVGFNLNYIWGDYQHTSTVSYSDENIQSLSRMYKATINAPTFDFGLQYDYQLDKKNKFTLGLTYGIGNKISQRSYLVSARSGGNTSGDADTVMVPNSFQLPNTIGVGLTWDRKSRWMISADYTIQFWDRCRFPSLKKQGLNTLYKIGYNSLRNRHKVAVGVQYIPSPRGYKVRDHVAYRAGFSYTTPYTKINGKDGPEYYLISAGVGLPIVNKYSNRSMINISAQWEHAGAPNLNGIKEDYLRLCVGLSLNATWFSKWKFE